MKKQLLFLLLIFVSVFTFGQDFGIVKGKVINAQSRKEISLVNIVVVGTTIGATSNNEGEFIINNVPLGYIKVEVSSLGYESVVSQDYLVTNEKSPFILIELNPVNEQLDEVLIKSKLFKNRIESPLSVQSLGIAEIEKNPGGNRDILKVIQSLPGVASNPGFRNDIIIRGGSPFENKFYLDGIEVPVINHYQTQGSTGGPVGIINADLIRNVEFYSSAFPANKGNALSAVIEFTQKSGNPEALQYRATLGTSDAGITVDGPLGKNTTFIASVRQSYLQFLFKLIKLPFLPTYNDAQFKVKTTFSDNSELAIIGLGAVDNFKLNESVNEGETEAIVLKRNNYILSNLPIQNQWNYMLGANYKRFTENGTQQFVLSRNEWSNNAVKYLKNTNNPVDLLLDYLSKEIENKFRFENTNTTKNDYKINFGAGLEQASYTNTTFFKFADDNGIAVKNFSSELNMYKFALFGQFSKKYWNSKLAASFGFRLDATNYNKQMKNLFNQFSPRIAFSYLLNNKWFLNSSAGIYHQLPSYTVLGFKDSSSKLVNQDQLKYLQSKHLVTGLEFRPDESSKITFEGFYKKYKNYPYSIRNKISLANLGADFGVIGNEEVSSTSVGKAYGFELLTQKKSYNGLYGILSYTYVKSEFKDQFNNFIPSSWDNRHLLTITGGKKLQKNWEIGSKFRLVGGKPFTPYNFEASSIIENYNVSNSGVFDFTKLNSERLDTYHQLDVRVDKTWYLKKMSFNFYVDIQNIYASKSASQSYLVPVVDANGDRVVNSSDASKYNLEEIENISGNILPRFGFIVDF